ncbi:TlpA family protein disulfide reductase [Ilumatobacter sp.]|uniref:TlpA family protein disulfide reductase n=1 Tax=Ilumatobacter sp. TaxID=1967498 RepID=UPI003C3CB737
MTVNNSSRRPIVRRAVVGLATASLLVSACGSSDDSGSDDGTTEDTTGDTASSGTDTPTTDDAATDEVQQNRPVSVEGAPLVPYDATLPADPAVGEAAPVVSGESFDGTPVTIGGATGSPTLAVFLAHWCPHCNEEVPQLIELEDSGEFPEGLEVIGVSTAVDPSGENFPPSEWIVDKGWPFATMADDEELTAMTAMGGTSFPFLVVLDADGNVLARRAGSAPAAETKAFLDEALANQGAA